MTIWQDIQRRVGVAADGKPGPATADAIAKALGMVDEPKRMSAAGVAMLKNFEGLAPKAYRCPADVLTIGYGHTVGVTVGQVVTEEEAEELLAADLREFEAAVDELAPVATQGQFDALVDFAFNLGIGALAGSTLLALHRGGDHAGAAEQFSRWIHGGGKVLPGLVKRRAAEKRFYEGRV